MSLVEPLQGLLIRLSQKLPKACRHTSHSELLAKTRTGTSSLLRSRPWLCVLVTAQVQVERGEQTGLLRRVISYAREIALLGDDKPHALLQMLAKFYST